jgi:NAD(P)-dependent dehydrogenase (short-subunit alcohol dehydrogenase family)
MDGKESLEQVGQTLPARRIAQAIEIAGAAVYLASDEASYVHGTTIAVDGGGLAVVV